MMTWMVIALLVAATADTVTTYLALRRPGTMEGNPILRRVMAWTGRAWPIAKTLMLTPALYAAYIAPDDVRVMAVIGALALAYAVVAWRNLRFV